MILLLGAAIIALLCMGLLLIQRERREDSRVASERISGWKDLAIPLLGIATMALLCTAGLLSAPRRTTTTPPPTANLVPAAIAPTLTVLVATPRLPAAPSPTTTPQPTQPTPTATLAATGTPPATSPTARSGPQVQAAVDKARMRFDQVRALHFVLTMEGGVDLDLSGTQQLTAAAGDLLRPDRVSLTATLSAGPVNTALRLIQIGGDAYLMNMRTGQWEQAPAGLSYDAGLLFDKDRGVSAILGKGSGWQLVETVTVNGVETQHVRGPVPAESVNDLVGSSLRGEYVDVDLYIEPRNADIVKFIVSERPSVVPANAPTARWTLDLSKQNETITIEAPTLGG